MAYSPSQSRRRTILAILIALPVASWSFVGILWVAFLLVRQNIDEVRESLFFLPMAAIVVLAALAVATSVAFLVFRFVRGKNRA